MGVNEIDFRGLSASRGLNDGLQIGAALGGMYRRNRLQDNELELRDNQRAIDDAARDAYVARSIEDPAQRQAYLQRRVERIQARGGDPSDTLGLMQLPFEQQTQELDYVVQKALPVSTFSDALGSAQVRAQQLYKNGVIVQSTDKGRVVLDKNGRMVQGEEAAKAIKEAAEYEVKFAGDKSYSGRSGTLDADIDKGGEAAEVKKFGELTGQQRATRIDEAFDRVQKIDSNLGNLNRALAALDKGASTGAIETRFFPTIKAATVELEQVQRELGLDVVSSVTFGALSEAELDLALETALPTKLPPEELRKFLNEKKAAQEKLKTYFMEQMDFLDNGGTIQGFLRSKQRSTPANSSEKNGQVEPIESIGRFSVKVK